MTEAPGRPGIEARWTSSAKAGVGTAISPTSTVWFTLSHGILNEIYFPRMDVANTRDAQLLIISRDGGFWEEKRDLTHHIQYISQEAPAFLLINEDPDGRFRITKRIVTWPSGNALVQQTEFTVLKGRPSDYRVFLLVAPHMGNQGGDNSAELVSLRGRPGLLAWRDQLYLCVTATVPFKKQSVGFVGISDGWSQLFHQRDLVEYQRAEHGNVAMTAEMDFSSQHPIMVVMSFGRNRREALFTAELTLLHEYANIESHYIAEWSQYLLSLPNLLPEDDPHSHQQRVSAMVLKTHHGKLFPGGIIASLSIPWGQACGDGNIGGYHLVWPRDMVEAANALIALGDVNAARQSLLFLMATQQENGAWAQNFWLDGLPYWPGSQLDETAFPIHLAFRLHQLGAMRPGEDPYPMVKKAMGFLVQAGPVTQQERWEEDGGYSPATLAACISGLLMGASLARERNDLAVAEYAEAVADYWQANLDRWTFTTQGAVDPRYPRHYIRIHVDSGESSDGNIQNGWVPIKNRPPGAPNLFPEVAVIDGGFLELVRHGLKSPHDPHIMESVQVYDAVLRRDLPYGPLYYRYNFDGYGEQADGSPYQGTGIGRLWPLLAGERGHYAVASGEDPLPYLRAMEGAASDGGLIPEQVWDGPDIPERELFFGRPSGSAMPLVWAHAEYVKLLRSILTGSIFETQPLVVNRYANQKANTSRLFWQFNHKRRKWFRGEETLRIAVGAPAQLIYTKDDWQHHDAVTLTDSGLGMYYIDISLRDATAVEFTFYWTQAAHWEGQNFRLEFDPSEIP
ncbi:MAG: glycoside hydrolase family 15 protein [Firmicutes bacterium]|nr:glycoside hydrolase family 15 protein [Bacillota bacterium]